MTPDPLTVLCAILRGDLEDLPSGDAGARVIQLARDHRVHLLLAWRLHQQADAASDWTETATALAGEVPREALLDELHVRELMRVIAALEDRDYRPLVFKGAALAHTHYAESWLRPRLDIDLLIGVEQRTKVFDRLRDLGYERPTFISGELVMHQTPFVRIDGTGVEHVLDVHWRIANPQVFASVLSRDEMLRAASTISVQGQPLRVPSPAHALLLACVHRAAHHNDAEDLLWLFDIHLIAERLTPLEWDDFGQLATDRAVIAVCARGLSLSVDRLATRIPSAVMSLLAEKANINESEPTSLYLKKDLRLVDRLASDLRALGPRAGARLLREHLFPPAEYMRGMYGDHSRALLPALYLRRILAGASKWLRPEGKLSL